MKYLKIAGVLLLGVFFAMGCCRKPPKEVGDAEAAITEAEKNCPQDYNVESYDKAKSLLDEANNYVSEKDCSEAKDSALKAIDMATKAEKEAKEAMKKAKNEANTALSDADNAIDRARKAEAPEYASGTFNDAKSKLSEAKKLAEGGDCDYLEVKKLADGAVALAEKAKKESIAEKKRLEKKRQKALEAKRKAEREAQKWNTWEVEEGDTLWDISSHKKIYENPFQWPLIWKANRSQISDPDLIYPDQKFDIPREYSDADTKDAVSHAKTRYKVWPKSGFLSDGK